MKILIIANTSIVFGKELKNELINNDNDVFLLDFESLKLFDAKNNLEDRYSKTFSKYKSIPKLSMFLRMYLISRILKEYSFEIVNIHYSRWFYLLILNTLCKSKLVITFYGSDFYRASDGIKNIQRKLYKKADAITFTNPLTKESFLEYYNDFEGKSFVCRFGLKTLEFIDKNRGKDIVAIKKSLGYNPDKTIVTCGYNSTIAQQHEEMIKNIDNLDINYKDRCQFIFPLTYGDNNHKKSIKNRLKSATFDYIVLEDFLYEDDNAYIKLASDVMINILQTDSFSGSMQEFLYAGNAIITGSWLPYELFDKEGIVYYKIGKSDELTNKIMDVLDNIEDIRTNVKHNRNIIYKLSSWKHNISQWENMYKFTMNGTDEN